MLTITYLMNWEFLSVPFPDRLMDDVSLSHLEIDFICNKVRGKAVTFSNLGMFLCTNLAVFFNIVQNAFDAPYPSF